MNKELKQLLVKFTIIVGVIILSAFITRASAFFSPTNGDVSLTSSDRIYASMPKYYTNEDFYTNRYLCCKKGTPVENESEYKSGNPGDIDSYSPTEETKRAREEFVTFAPQTWTQFWIQPDSHGRVSSVRTDVSRIYYDSSTPRGWIGTKRIKFSELFLTHGTIEKVGNRYRNAYIASNIREHSYKPAWQKTGGLGEGDLVYRIVNINSYLSRTIRLLVDEYDSSGNYIGSSSENFTYGELGMDSVWRQLMMFSAANPTHTTTLGDAYPAGAAANSNPDDVMFQYIYAEGEASSEGEPFSPVQYANWLALGQMSASDIEKAEHVGNAGKGYSIFEEAREYRKFRDATKGKLVKEFIDVKDADGNVIPTEVSSDDEGNILVGPFAMNYTEWGIDAGRGWAQFAGIYDFKITTNDKPDGLNENEFQFIYSNEKRQTNNLVKPYYPHSQEVFYLKVKKAENRTEFRDINFKFRYLNVTGGALEIVENLYYYEWKIQNRGGWYCLVGTLYDGPIGKQNQSIEIHGQRTYMSEDLHFGMYPVYLTLTKNVVNKLDNNNQLINYSETNQGQELTLGKSYKFVVKLYPTKESAINDGKVGNNTVEPLHTYELNLVDNQTEAITQYFTSGTSVPYYRIEEVDAGGASEVTFKVANSEESEIYQFEHGICGYIGDKHQVSVESINGYDIKSAKLTLSKVLGEPAVEDEVYKLNVAVTDNAKSILEDYSSALNNSVELRVKKDEKVAQVYIDGQPTGKTSVDFKYVWMGDQENAPRYSVTEEDNTKYVVTFNGTEVDKIEGQFEDKFNGEVQVNAVNNRVKSKIRIDKVSEPALEPGDEKTYFFNIKVGEGYSKDVTLTLKNDPNVPDDKENAKQALSEVYEIVLENKNGDKYIITEYPDEESRLKGENGKIVSEGILTEADGNDESKYTKKATNVQADKEIEYKIRKTFANGNVPKEDIVFTFDTKAEQAQVEIAHQELKASVNNNWETEKTKITWGYGTATPSITIKEAKDQSYSVNGFKAIKKSTGDVITLDSSDYVVDTINGTITINPSGIDKLLAQGNNDFEFTFEIENKLNEYQSKIIINKMIDGIDADDPNEYPFDFEVEVTYPGKAPVKETLTASNKKTAEKLITWEGNLAPAVKVFEIYKDGSSLKKLLVNTEEKSVPSVVDGKYLLYSTDSITIAETDISIDVTNSIENTGAIDIQKVLLDRYGKEIKDGKIFSFIIKERMNGNLINDKKVEIKTGDSYTYATTWIGNQAPTFEVSEIAINGYIIENVEVEPSDGVTVENGVVKGTFEKDHTIKVKFTNREVKKLNGTVTVAKKVVSTTGATIPNDFDKSFNFSIDITKNGNTESKPFSLKSGEVYSEEIEWMSNEEIPTYTIKELDNENIVTITKDGQSVDINDGIVSGTFAENSTVKYEYVNGIKVNMGKLSLTKVLTSGSDNIDEEYFFDIIIDGNRLPVVTLKVGETWESEVYTWIGDEGPEYTITEENPENSTFDHFEVDGRTERSQTVSGRLTPMENSNSDSVKVICYNEAHENKAKVTIVKKAIVNNVKNPTIDDIISKYNGKGFKIDVSIVYNKGKFFVGNDPTPYSPERAYKTTLIMQADEKVTLPEVMWYGDDNEGPKVIVHESWMPDGWSLININNNNVILKPNADETITVENEWSSVRIILMPMGGTVWADERPEVKGEDINGAMDSNEVGIQGVGVVVKRYLVDKNDNIIADTGYAKAYNIDGEEIKVYPVYTDETGRWDIRRIELPGLTEAEIARGAVAARYGVEYIYDGYTYEPTKYIAGFEEDETSNIVRAADFANIEKTPVTTRNSMLDKSYALDKENSRTAFNNQFKIISGDTAIASDNTTSGFAIGTDGTRRELKYEGTQVSYQGNTHLVSELVTTGVDGRILPQYQVTAYTLFGSTNPVNKAVSQSGLAYPFDLNYNIAQSSRTIKTEEYVATDPYLRNINLGLVRRADADLEVTKDVSSAKVIVNQTLKEYTFSRVQQALAGDNPFNIVAETTESDDIRYTLGLYKTDYYYRAQAYATNSDVYNGLETFYKDILKYNEEFTSLMNLRAYVTYTIRVRNTSPTDKYDIGVNTIIDYSDKSLELVRSDTKNYIKDDSGNGSEVIVARAPYYQLKGENGQGQVEVVAEGVNTVDGFKYTTIKDSVTSRVYNRNEMRFGNNGVVLGPNQYVDIITTYRLKNYSEDTDGITLTEAANEDNFINRLNLYNADGIELGDKANIAEVKSYSVYAATTNPELKGKVCAGRIDRDSAPNNLDIVSRNNKEFYEDDTNSAPTLTVKLNDSTSNTVSGTVWEDNEVVNNSKDVGVALGDGIYDSNNEAAINGMNIELVEKVRIPTGTANEYYEYDFTWPDNYDVQKNAVTTDDNASQTLKALTGFDATTSSIGNGIYSFDNVPSGDYIVRFHYGDNNGGYTNKVISSASASNLTEKDVYKFSAGGDEMASSKNVADTKTSAYDDDKFPAVYNGQDFKSAIYGLNVNDEWLSIEANANANVSKAADSQARRLEVINKSRVLNNTNTTILASANEINADHEKLYDDYRMFADTPKIKFGATANSISYDNVGFGLVERPETRLVLDKQIEQIVLKDNNNHELIKVVYDIDYSKAITQRNDGSYILEDPSAAVTINEEKSFGTEYLQSLNKIEDKYGFLNGRGFNSGVQNFRYIVYDTSMAQSLTLETTYRISALNLGQADRTSQVLQNMTDADINAIAQILKANKFSGNTRTYNGEKYGNYKVENNTIVFNGKTLSLTNRFTDVLGSMYYTGNIGSDVLVRTKVGQVIDYVDNTLEYDQSINSSIDGSWNSTTDDYLYHNDIVDKSLFTTVDYNLLQGDAATSETKSKIVDKDGKYYDNTSKHNIILSVINEDEASNNDTNPNFLKKTVPLSQESTDQVAITQIALKTTRSIDPEKEDLIFDNIAEIIRYENEVGRRTISTVAGNSDPKGAYTLNNKTHNLGEFAGALKEIDSSATEIITFSNPYGVSDKTRFITEITIGIFSALVIVAVGIVVVKKKVL